MLISKNYDANYIRTLNKKAEPLKFLYPMAAFLKYHSNILSKSKMTNGKNKLYQELYINNSVEMQKVHYYKKVSLILMIGISFTIITLLQSLSIQKNSTLQANQILRPNAGDGDQKVNIALDTDSGYQWNLDIKVSEKKLSGEEITALFMKVKAYIDEEMLGDNLSVDEVSSDLNLMKGIPGTSIDILWKAEDSTYIRVDGTVLNDNISKEGALVKLIAEITYYEQRILYTKYIKIVPKDFTEEELLYQSLKKQIDEINNNTQNQEILELPKKIGDNTLHWQGTKNNKLSGLLFLGVIASAAIVIGMDSNLKKLSKIRQVQLLIDYPEIVSKFTLLLNAGMTIRGAFERITADYQRRIERERRDKKHTKSTPSYAYEELQVAMRELEVGKPETQVYESFGQRCTLLCYLRFSTIIVQNMKKGTKGIVQMLEMEAMEAFAERKECAKRLGEEAGTKLLGPMIGMLAIVLVIIMVPAFMSFNI